MMSHSAILDKPGTNAVDIRQISDTPARWDEFVKKHSHGSPFHLTAWQRMIAKTFGHQQVHIVAQAADEIVGILPLFLVRSRLFGRVLVSTPQAAYGGILATSEAVARAILDQARHLATESNVEFLELRGFRNPVSDDTLLKKDLYVTFRQELQKDPEANLLAIPRKTRAEVREGIKHGLEFKVDAIGPKEFFDVYSRSVHSLGTPVFPQKLFRAGLEEFGSDCKI